MKLGSFPLNLQRGETVKATEAVPKVESSVTPVLPSRIDLIEPNVSGERNPIAKRAALFSEIAKNVVFEVPKTDKGRVVTAERKGEPRPWQEVGRFGSPVLVPIIDKRVPLSDFFAK